MNGNIPPEPAETTPTKAEEEKEQEEEEPIEDKPTDNGDNSVEEPVERKIISLDTGKSEDEIAKTSADDKKSEDWQVIDEQEVEEAREAAKSEEKEENEPEPETETTEEPEEKETEKAEEEKTEGEAEGEKPAEVIKNSFFQNLIL